MSSEIVKNDSNLVDLETLAESLYDKAEEQIILPANKEVIADEELAHTAKEPPTTADMAADQPGMGDEQKFDEEQVGELSDSAGGNELSYDFKCVFCDLILGAKDAPKILECLHNACDNCVQQKQQESENARVITCSVCGYAMDVNNIIENQFLIESSSSSESDEHKTEDVKCSSCSDEALATSWCVDCSEFICDNCVRAHMRLKITKDHTIKHKDDGIQAQGDGGGRQTPMFCGQHPHERLSLFCLNCDKLTCRDCQLTEHREHKYKFTHEIAVECRDSLNSMLKDISYKRILLVSAMKVIDDRQGLINEKKQVLVQQITNLVVNLTNAVNARGKKLVARLNEVCDSKQKTLDQKKVELDNLAHITDYCINFTQNVLSFDGDNALLHSKKLLTNHLQRVKSRRADIPNPEIPVRIDLSVEKVSDIIKVISNIGQIIVDGRVCTDMQTTTTTTPPHSSPSPRGSASHMQQQSSQMSQSNIYMPPQQQQARGPTMTYGAMMQNRMQMMHQSQSPLQNLSATVQNLSNSPKMPDNNYATRYLGVPPQAPHMQMNRMHMPPNQGVSANMRSQPMRMMPPAMNQQVSSSTHPQSNLRTLLQPSNSAVYIQTGPNQYQAVQPQYLQQFQGRAPYRPQQQQQQCPSNERSRPPSYNSIHLRCGPSGSKWHIPQHSIAAESGMKLQQMGAPSTPTLNSNYKIMLKTPNAGLHQSVTSTNPKTPSPIDSLNNENSTEKSIDKFCEESVNDLMATIAKLDSNGVQVLAENRAKTGSSPMVDSSTGDVLAKLKNEVNEKDDPNEDWCAVCMDGGELVCCDKCPKVFHQFCHIPNLSVEESDTWQCLLCYNFADTQENDDNVENTTLSPRKRKLAQRIILELYCQYDLSLPFRELISADNTSYYEIITRPIALDTIRTKLDWNAEDHYKSLEELVKDVRLMFKNARLYNAIDSKVYKGAVALEKFFDEQLEKWLPEYAYEMFEDDDEIPPPTKKYKRILTE